VEKQISMKGPPTKNSKTTQKIEKFVAKSKTKCSTLRLRKTISEKRVKQSREIVKKMGFRNSSETRNAAKIGR